MKKYILLFGILFSTINIFAQHSKSDIIKKDYSKEADSSKNQFPSYGLKLFENYNDISTNYKYGAVGCATVSAGLLIGFGCTKDRYEINDAGESKMNDKSKVLVIGGSVFAALAIILELHAIKYKMEAGKSLNLYIKENQAKLSYVF